MKKKHDLPVVVVMAALAALVPVISRGDVLLCEKGVPKAEIVIADGAPKAVRFAAVELAAHLRAMTGGEFTTVTPDRRDPRNAAVYIGDSEPMRRAGFSSDALGPQETLMACRNGAVYLLGRDKPDTGVLKFALGAPNEVLNDGHPAEFQWPGYFDDRGSLHATYDFLRDVCGVDWLDPTDAGTVVPHRPTLRIAAFPERRSAPYVKCRASLLRYGGYSPELWRTGTEGWTNFIRIAYAKELKRKFPLYAIETQKRLFALRMKAGGELIVSNHSFYPWYERFWDKDSPNFESYHPEYFSTGWEKGAQGKDFKRPPQICLSNPAVVTQAVADVRDYFDNGGYRKRFAGVSVLGYLWGENNFPVEMMDNHAFCQCPDCVRQYHPERAADRGEQSDYVFGFVKKVADEIAKSHPDKKISALAYMSREGVPRNVRLPDNVIIHFTFHGNRLPNSALFELQQDLIRQWRRTYPNTGFGVWLYHCFPEHAAKARGFRCFPGFFSKILAKEYRLLKELNVRECVFYDGMRDDFESWLSFAWMWNPDEPLPKLKDRYFASYGAAEKPIRAFYDLVEERFCDKSLYGGSYEHESKKDAWMSLGDDETMDRLENLMRQAERAQGLTAQARARVANWKANYWVYMHGGKHPRKEIPSDRPGVRAYRVEHLYAARPEPFGRSVIAGLPVTVTLDGREAKLTTGGAAGETTAKATSVAALTDGDFKTQFRVAEYGGHALYRIDKRIRKLTRARLTVERNRSTDSRRSRLKMRLVGFVKGKEVDLTSEIEQQVFFIQDGTADRKIWQSFDFEFDPGSVPANLDGIGIRDDTGTITDTGSAPAQWSDLIEFEVAEQK